MNIVKTDTEFAASARQLQDNWRKKNKFPIGTYKQKQKDGSYKDVELGNYIEKEFAFEKGANFLSKNIRDVVMATLKNKEKGAKIAKTRLYTNLLSSQPLAFNLFAELSRDYELATKFFKEQFPKRIKEITKIIFEHSDGRGDCEYTCDHSAFDVFIEFKPLNGKRGFIGIEVKYSENLKDALSSHKKRYEELTNNSKLFRPGSIELLKKRPIQQIWRDHLLSISHLKHRNEKYDDGFFVYLFPTKNNECKNGVKKYIKQFISYNNSTGKYDEKATGFYVKDLKHFILSLQQLNQDKWTKDLLLRYFGEIK